jgi:hypothetical protein
MRGNLLRFQHVCRVEHEDLTEQVRELMAAAHHRDADTTTTTRSSL